MESKEKKAFEPSGLVPRSIVRTFDRFRQQLLPGSETAVIREYRISRYQVLVSARCLFTLLIIPIVTNWLVSSWVLSPVIEHFWNTQQNEIFLNSYQEERAFSELESFLEKLFFESLLINNTSTNHKKTVDSLSLVDVSSVLSSNPENIVTMHPKEFSTELLSVHPLYLDARDAPDIKDVPSLKTLSKIKKGLPRAFQKSGELKTKNNTLLLQTGDTTLPFLSQRVGNVSTKLINPFLLTNMGAAKNEISQKRTQFHNFNFNSVNFLDSEIDSIKLKEKIQGKILELAFYYNQQTILSITNVVGDIVSFLTLGCLFIWMRPEIAILKSFLIEAIYSLSDTTKSFLLILLTDLLVGFHSPRGWETALELLLKHFGLPENQDFVFLFVATFPVLLDTVFKYWIFRHLNKISPSTVATYHSMIE